MSQSLDKFKELDQWVGQKVDRNRQTTNSNNNNNDKSYNNNWLID